LPRGTESDRYAEFFEQAPIGRLSTDGLGVIAEANRAAAELLNVSRDFLVGKPLAAFVPPEDRPAFQDRLLALADSPGPVQWVAWLEPHKGPAFHSELHVTRSDTSAGSLHWTMADVTDRVAMEQELRLLASDLEGRVEERTGALQDERARLEAVVQQIPIGLTIVDENGEVVLVNDEARRLLGGELVPAARLGDAHWAARRLDDEPHQVDDLPAARALRGETVSRERVKVVDPPRGSVVLEVSAGPIRTADGEVAGAVIVFHDISAQEQQQRAEREFVTNAAHQLQSPLAAIVSAVEVLQAGAKDGPEQDVFLEHIEREANRLARLTRALLILSRAQTGVEPPRDQVVAIEPLLSEVASSLRPAPGVSVEVLCAESIAVLTNRELAEQAVLNIAENAAKYTTEGRITLEAEVRDDMAQIVVTDTGVGISQRDQPRVLDRFYRASANGSVEGFGLGLAIVRSAVDALGGELELDSTVGAGTVVRMRLPRAVTLVEP
jgi:PAS domain S-box-containing protein